MRLYLIHRKYYLAFLAAQNAVEKIIDEKEMLLAQVQPKSSLAEHDREFMPGNVAGGKATMHKAEAYAIQVEQRAINTRLAEAKSVLAERYMLLLQKEDELRKSRDIYNMVYTLKWVDGLKADMIVQETGYSRSQVYNIIGHITKQIERQLYCADN